jgi:hypothetical protein
VTNSSEPACPKCGAPRAPAPSCPKCGVIYAKADARARALAEPQAVEVSEAPPPGFEPPVYAPAVPVPETAAWAGESEDAETEFRFRVAAIPVALVVALAMVSTGAGRFIGRTFLSMWVHETGHAVAAWFCGYTSFPGPWFTPVAQSRSWLMPVALGGALGYLIYSSWKAQRRAWLSAGVGLVLLQVLGTLALSHDSAQVLITFAGDAGCLVLGTALMCTFFTARGTKFHQGWLRWGFLVIGAVSFMDVFEQWWASRSDVDRIPFGENEGTCLSDPSKLSDTYGWSTSRIVNSYVWLGIVCLVVLAAVYAWGVSRGHKERALAK